MCTDLEKEDQVLDDNSGVDRTMKIPGIKFEQGLGDKPIEPGYVALMRALAKTLDDIFNRDKDPKETGFILMVFPFDEVAGKGRCNYISNAKREDVVVMLKEQIARFEGMPEAKGTG